MDAKASWGLWLWEVGKAGHRAGEHWALGGQVRVSGSVVVLPAQNHPEPSRTRAYTSSPPYVPVTRVS